MLRRPFLLLLLALVFLLGACGDDETSPTGTPTSTVTESSSSSTEQTSTTEEASTTSAGSTENVTRPTGFASPSGNIGCYITKSSVRCDIGERDWEPPKAPADCDLDYGQGIELSAGSEAVFVCAGDTTLGASGELAYGDSIASGLLTCESAESGMTCTDTESGRGFTLSQQAYEIF